MIEIKYCLKCNNCNKRFMDKEGQSYFDNSEIFFFVTNLAKENGWHVSSDSFYTLCDECASGDIMSEKS